MTTIVYYYGTVSFRVDSVRESLEELEEIFKDVDGFGQTGEVYQVSWCIERDTDVLVAEEVMTRTEAMEYLENEVDSFSVLDGVPKCFVIEDVDMWDEDWIISTTHSY